MLAKHTKHLNLVDILAVGVDRTQRARELPLLLDKIRCGIRGLLLDKSPFHVPVVPMSVKVPVVASMLYMETLFEPEFVT